MTNYPTSIRLWATWAVLMGLTTLSLTAADATDRGAVAMLGFLPVLLVLAAAFFKAIQILWIYLNLRRSTIEWKAGFTAFLLLLCSLIAGAYALSLRIAT